MQSRSSCSDDCIRRIAVRLCELQDCAPQQTLTCDSSTEAFVNGCYPLQKGQTSEQSQKTEACCISSKSGAVSRPADAQRCCSSDTAKPECSVAATNIKDCCTSGRVCSTLERSAGKCNDSTTSRKDQCEDDYEAGVGDDKAEDSPSFCDRHFQDAYNRYAALIRAGLCVCRKVMDDFGFYCCSPSQQSPAIRGSSSKSTSATRSHKHASYTTTNEKPCTTTTVTRVNKTDLQSKEIRLRNSDIEHDSAREHVVVRIAGMTCTGCAKKVNNVMQQVPGLSNLIITFVSESAEFDLDTKIISAVHALAQIEKQTGFKLSRVDSDYQHLDVMITSDLARQLLATHPKAVIAVDMGRKGVGRITYDASLVGARSLLLPGIELAPPAQDEAAASGQLGLHQMLLGFCASAVLTIPVLVLNWSAVSVPRLEKDIISCVLATMVQTVAVPFFYIPALKALIYSRVVEMDMLVVISITAAYGYSVVAFAVQEAGIELETGPFFETSTLLITLVLLGRLVSVLARVRASAAISTRSLQADRAVLVKPDTVTEEIDARLLHFEDVIRVAAHTQFVTDGRVLHGLSSADESIITGESAPVHKEAGDAVIAGTMNGSGVLDVLVTRLPGKNSINDIARVVQDALKTKPKVQELADKLAGYFVPAVVAIGIVVFVIWIAVAVAVRHLAGGSAVGLSITYAIAVFAVSCPCALGLAVPMALVVAGGVAAKHGIIVKAADAIERGWRTTDVVFDKTGTLTELEMQVQYEKDLSEDGSAYAIAKAIVKDNDHPVAKAVSAWLEPRSVEPLMLSQVQSVPGAGMEAQWYSKHVKAGDPYWLGVQTHNEVVKLMNKALTCFCVTIDEQLVLVLGLRSPLKQRATEVISRLRATGKTCHILSGDIKPVVDSIASEVGIEAQHSISRASPSDKQQYIKRLQADGRRVLFVGDGTNDAAAIAQADVGVQLGRASDLNNRVADVVLLGGLDGVPGLLYISGRAFMVIVFNFAWAAIYNLFAILLAAGAFVKVRIPPTYAGLGELVSVLPVIIAAMSLLLVRVKIR